MRTLSRLLESIPAHDEALVAAARRHLDTLTKPPGSLGRLEDLAARLSALQGGAPHVDQPVVGADDNSRQAFEAVCEPGELLVDLEHQRRDARVFNPQLVADRIHLGQQLEHYRQNHRHRRLASRQRRRRDDHLVGRE